MKCGSVRKKAEPGTGIELFPVNIWGMRPEKGPRRWCYVILIFSRRQCLLFELVLASQWGTRSPLSSLALMTRMVPRWLLGELVEICMSVVSRTYIRNGEHYECHQRNGYTFLDTNFRLCRPRFLHRPKSAVAQLTLFTPLEWQFVQRECSLEILWSKLEKLSECFAHNCAWNKSRRESTTSLLHCLCLCLALVQPTEQINWNIK